jgi:hypothetical protein
MYWAENGPKVLENGLRNIFTESFQTGFHSTIAILYTGIFGLHIFSPEYTFENLLFTYLHTVEFRILNGTLAQSATMEK